LASRPRRKKLILYFLEAGGSKPCGLLDKTPPTRSPCQIETKILSNVEDLTAKQQASKHKIHATTKLQGCVKLPKNRQYNTSLGKGKNGGRIYILHLEGF
jgi:hypothetical protein